jgi:curved DNA-binding protein CbpA
MKISAAYTVLGNPETRQRYDRDILKTTSHGNVAPRGSYHSSGPAGGRPASGLSRRRTHFQGPPPSFYRNGGWGSEGAKRQAAQESAEPGNFKRGDGPQGPSGGMGYGQQPYGPANDVPHFDRDGHFRTHSNHEKRRMSRHVQEEIPSEPSTGIVGNFFLISGILTFGILLPGFVFERLTRKSDRER